jgi:carbazole 1,9a-dioxygenase terminal dioxygenase component
MANTIGDYQREPLEAWEEQRRKPWQLYVDAELGLRNHWYPAFFGGELAEGDVSPASGAPVSAVKSLTMLGERILFRRIGGRVYAVQDWCLHRGVPFSHRPECYTHETITCWYHGFTYDIRDGVLTAVVTDPKCPLIGKVRLRSYPVEERQGIVFVFIGDAEPVPPLEHDVQPGFLDENLAVLPDGWSREVACNWRPAAENGFDPAHAYIHRNSPLVEKYKIPTVLGDTDISRSRGMDIIRGKDAPCGIRLLRGTATPVWEATVGDVTVAARYRPGEAGVMEGMVPEVSIWMPCGLKVDPFPTPETIHFEWYVPVDETTHRYLITWGRPVSGDEERAAFEDEMRTDWRDVIPAEFNNDDVFAREGMAEFYADQNGWYRERLFGPDVVITEWRKLVSRNARGVQRRGLQ